MTSNTTPTPSDTTEDQLAEHFEGRPLRDPRRYYKDGICRRCEEKNMLRMKHTDTEFDDLPDETFEERERIRFTAVHREFQNPDQKLWTINACFHERHPHKPTDEIAAQGVAQVIGSATVVPAGDAAVINRRAVEDMFDEVPEEFPDQELRDGELVLADVTIEFYSPPNDGEDDTADDSEGMVVAKEIGDRPDWPEEENEWRRELIQNAKTSNN
jgi:hypothetical protein